jgi:cytochrome c oxidase subunit 2
MIPSFRRRRPALALRAATALAALAAFGVLGACGPSAPNSVFTRFTETNADVTSLHQRLFFFGTVVFVLVEALLLYTIIRYRRKPGQAEPRHVHGNTTLEVLWTAIPAVILIFIAVPTVRTIFRTQAKARPGALQVEVIGHQWWWEFRYPEYNITTANELYLPTGRTVNFALKTADVLHSFWIPALSGKRDLIANHTNFLWFTPDSAGLAGSDNTKVGGAQSWNGHCAEYCGASHANMKFRTYTVTPAQFASWVEGQRQVAAFGAVAGAGTTSGPQTVGAPAAEAATAKQAGVLSRPSGPKAGEPPLPEDAAARNNPVPTQSASGRGASGNPAGDPNPVTAQQQAQFAGVPPGFVYPADKLPAHVRPSTPIRADLERRVNVALVGDPARGQKIYSSNSCIGCHYINGNPSSIGKIGPNLTHFGSRNTLAAGLYPNDTKNLRAWLKNSRAMKPGVTMPTLGLGEVDPITKQKVTAGGLTDQQIADIAAYLQALK